MSLDDMKNTEKSLKYVYGIFGLSLSLAFAKPQQAGAAYNNWATAVVLKTRCDSKPLWYIYGGTEILRLRNTGMKLN